MIKVGSKTSCAYCMEGGILSKNSPLIVIEITPTKTKSSINAILQYKIFNVI